MNLNYPQRAVYGRSLLVAGCGAVDSVEFNPAVFAVEEIVTRLDALMVRLSA